MTTFVQAQKENLIDRIITYMKPNTYADTHILWARVKRGLEKLSYEQLSAIHILLICKHKE